MKDFKAWQVYGLALAGLSLVSAGFVAADAVSRPGFGEWYLLWNLFLAWIPLVLSFTLVRLLHREPWSSWPAIGLSLAWLLFLPNSFYMVSDFIHLQDLPAASALFGSLVFSICIAIGLIAGFTSLSMVQGQLRRRLPATWTAVAINLILLLCSFAIYLGRNLRWNSWDVLLSPAGILFDVSERVLDPLGHPLAFSVTAMFFVFLASLYWAMRAVLYSLRLARDDNGNGDGGRTA